MASNVIKVICGESPDPPIFTPYTPIGGLKPRRGGLNDGGDLMSLTPIVFLESHFFKCVTIVLQVYYKYVSSVLGVFVWQCVSCVLPLC